MLQEIAIDVNQYHIKYKYKYKIKIINNEQDKIQLKSSIVYMKKFKIKETECHAYKLKQERSFKIVLNPCFIWITMEIKEKEIKEYASTGNNISNIKK
jgi:hypothetical protein